MVKETKLYDALGITPTASETDVKKAYKVMALKYHPDKNKHSKESTEKFQEITEAYQILSDSTQRLIYDRYGANGVNNNQTIDPTSARGFTANPDQLFSQFFGNSFFNAAFGSSSHRQAPKQKKGPDINHKLSCTLEDLYNGKTARLGLSRTVLCPLCDAKGGSNIKQCSQCKGHGRVAIRKQMGPMIQRFETTCPSCRGSGEFVSSADICVNCQGAKTVEERKILKVEVQPGAKDGDLIVLDGEGDQGPNIIPGDVVVTIVQKPHPLFKRVECNLYYRPKIDLLTALNGGSFTIKHLNGQYLKINIERGEVITPNKLKTVQNFGIPKDKSSYGDLILHFEVEFPQANEINFELLEKALPQRPQNQIPLDAKPIEPPLTEFTADSPEDIPGANSGFKRRRADVDGDMDMNGHFGGRESAAGENVQCASQ